MNYIGRALGLILGYKILGLFGAIIGFYIGSLFDRGLKIHIHHIPPRQGTHGHFHVHEEGEYYAHYDHFQQQQQQQQQQQHQQQYYYAPRDSSIPLQEAYGVLGVSAAASPIEIKKAYKKLMNQHHPDKLMSRGVSESIIKLAKEKTQQITAAYHLICKARGFR